MSDVHQTRVEDENKVGDSSGSDVTDNHHFKLFNSLRSFEFWISSLTTLLKKYYTIWLRENSPSEIAPKWNGPQIVWKRSDNGQEQS